MRALLILAALVLAACAPKPPSQPEAATPTAAVTSAAASTIPVETATPAARPADEAACKTAGGNWQPVCRRQMPMCVMTFPDAQKACSGKADCMGQCLAHGDAKAGDKAEGLCSANDDPCGCRQLVEGGIAQGTLCAD